jgi:hypothetical protein
MPPTLRYPTGVEYREALYNTKLCFKDPVLIGGKVVTDSLGMPKPISGASASVFTIDSANGRRWAVKCFTRFVDHQEIRYQRISEVLRAVNKPWRVEFEYMPEGVLSQGTWFPALKMEWVYAIGLLTFIERHLWEPSRLADLAIKFAVMIKDLSALGIAHGDLQHGNLLVTSSGELKLIDYDGMFVPSLAQIGACEKGHANYQSPARTMNTWGPHIDNFSAWIIYTSLFALTIDPTLWTLLHDPGDEALLFNNTDFADRNSSRAFLALTRSSKPELKALGNAISPLWTPNLQSIPLLDTTVLPALRAQPNVQGPAPSKVSAINASAASGAIPIWVTQAQTGAQATSSSVQGSAAWITGHLPPLRPIELHPPTTSLRLLIGLAIAAIVAVGVSAQVGILPAAIVSASALVIMLTFTVVTFLLFRRMPEWRAKREKLIIFKECKTQSSKETREVSKLDRVKREIDSREQKAIDKVTKRAEKAKATEKKELDDLDKKLAAHVRDLGRQKEKLQASEMREAGQALRAHQQQHVANRLSTASISSARIPGIGQGIVRSLAVNGIYNAADFTGLQYRIGPRGGQQIYIVRRDGITIHPSGVGEKKARDLESWRRSVEASAIATQPSSLPTPQAQTIKAKYMQQRQGLADQEQLFRAKTANDQRQVRQKWASEHAAISRELMTTRQTFAQERAQSQQDLITGQKRASTAAWRRELAERELAAYRNVNYRRYLAGILRP